MRERDWIDEAYREAENNSALASAREVARREKCGCQNCVREIKRVYTEWWRWGQTGKKPERVIYQGEKPRALIKNGQS